MKEATLTRKFAHTAGSGSWPNNDMRGVIKATRDLTARLDARFGFVPSPFRRKPKTKAA